jgi:phosphatidylglycerophosphate synthase
MGVTTYEPSSRRPIAAAFRATASGAVRLCVRLGIHPDVISYLSIVASLAAGVCFWLAGRWTLLLILAPLLCYARLWMNMLDGMVALAAGKASLRGEILNDLPDRASDVLIFAGVAHSGLCWAPAGYWAAIFALLTAYVGTLGQAVGARREFGGVMSKPWRMVVLNGGAWVTAVLLLAGRGIRYGGLSVLDWTCVVIVTGCVQTIWVRLGRTLEGLRDKARATVEEA